ncbi:hypothetical protein GCM10017687_79810 [Streptomyces echinatus]
MGLERQPGREGTPLCKVQRDRYDGASEDRKGRTARRRCLVLAGLTRRPPAAARTDRGLEVWGQIDGGERGGLGIHTD